MGGNDDAQTQAGGRIQDRIIAQFCSIFKNMVLQLEILDLLDILGCHVKDQYYFTAH